MGDAADTEQRFAEAIKRWRTNRGDAMTSAMLELAEKLRARADEIDNRLGPIPGRSTDAIAVELREAAAALSSLPHPSPTVDVRGGVIEEGIRWARINAEPFEYAIQQGSHGDEFVKLLNGSCMRRAVASLPKAQEAGR